MKSCIAITCFILFIAVSCKKDNKPQNNTIPPSSWVRADKLTDTISFSEFTVEGLDKYFVLKREYKVNASGVRVPVANEGPYSYEILGDKIKLQWALSGCFNCQAPYYFSNTNNQIVIGNFIEKDGKLITFTKIQ